MSVGLWVQIRVSPLNLILNLNAFSCPPLVLPCLYADRACLVVRTLGRVKKKSTTLNPKNMRSTMVEGLDHGGGVQLGSTSTMVEGLDHGGKSNLVEPPWFHHLHFYVT